MAGKGNPKGVGRPKGVGNNNNVAIKDMLREALEQKGNAAYFVRQADENPATFMNLIAKLIPNEINIDATVKQKYEPLVIKVLEK